MALSDNFESDAVCELIYDSTALLTDTSVRFLEGTGAAKPRKL
jgi:hypothetical protein